MVVVERGDGCGGKDRNGCGGSEKGWTAGVEKWDGCEGMQRDGKWMGEGTGCGGGAR